MFGFTFTVYVGFFKGLSGFVWDRDGGFYLSGKSFFKKFPALILMKLLVCDTYQWGLNV